MTSDATGPAGLDLTSNAALVLIDVQTGFADPAWGRPSPDAAGAQDNMRRLAQAWSGGGRPLVVVRHDSTSASSPLRPDAPGNTLEPWVAALDADVLITKTVNSAFIGDPALEAWLREREIAQIVVVGIQSNMCVETTARMGGNLGFDVIVPIDATSTFDLSGPDGDVLTAEELRRATATNLHGGGFARVVSTAAVLDAVTTAEASRHDDLGSHRV
ncbi:nicotinamidase-related amidase [Knoellia remsis]|uniref:Nicotinamidase-related amidase n=1 Tax=Knoellia remsis TaxID=407159 RepID=A0A2T0TZ35_9MICO|nr:isochorismatase family protein [Knoellia remsis]PRY50925.1 nicotinamidase-related amidase [Knoellia remsis]